MKKLKLVMSIATMCLALAVLCFGVFSATNITYTIGGSISYEVNDVFATVTTRVYTSNFADKSTLSAEAQKYVDGTGTGVDTNYKFDFQTKGLDSETFNNTTGVVDYPDNNTEGINIEYNTTNQRTYFVVISITNNGDNIISASVSGTLGENANTTFVKTNPITSLSKSNKQKIVMAFMLDDITLGMSDINFEYVVTINNGEYVNPIATFSYLNNDNKSTVEKTQVLTEQIFTDSNFELDVTHFDTQGYLYNFQLSDIDTSKFNNVQVTFSTSNSFMIFIAPKCYANFQEFGEDAASSVMGQDTASAYYDLTEATPLNFCIFILTDGETAPISGYNLKISISKSFTEGEFRYFATNNNTEWVVGPKDENITGNNGEITIPKTFQDKPVVGLQPAIGLFSKCINITKVIIQDNIKEIPMGCFYGSGIQEIVLGSAIELIGVDAFIGCSSLTSITIPSSVTSIGDSAFQECSSLTSIEIPSSVTSIGGRAFSYCSSLTSITIPSSVTSIGDGTFQECRNLTSITIPSSVTSIGSEAFGSCSSLTTVTFETGSKLTSIGDSAFWNCSSLTSITIPSSVTSIGTGAFSSCSGLTSINIPSRVTSIGRTAFYDCRSLTSIEIPSSVTSIGIGAFNRCIGLESITVSGTGGTYTAQGNCLIKGTELVAGCKTSIIPTDGSVTSIGDSAFAGYYSGLTSITIPNSVTSIGYNAFYGCSKLESIEIPSSVTSIGSNAFNDCRSLTIINFTGTQEQWNAISKANASIRSGAHVVCTDGTIVL